jgi:cyclopropane-fatty-acyl-phospholipid synthase
MSAQELHNNTPSPPPFNYSKPPSRQSQSRKAVEDLFALAGIRINGKNEWDIHVTNDEFFHRLLADGSVGFGDSYIEGWWDCSRLDELFYRITRFRLAEKVSRSTHFLVPVLISRLFNMQSKQRAFRNGQAHYDLGNLLYIKMLDKRMVYTCAYWEVAKTLDEAQEAKLELVCQKLHLEPGMRVLDIGCGWGSFLKYATEKYQVTAVGVTISREQVELGKKLCEGLPVELRLQDYREVHEKFDRVVSLGMFEHVGAKNYRTYMEKVRDCLAEDGLFLLQSIGANKSVKCGDPWIDKHIFPNGILPSIKRIGEAVEGLFVMEDWHNFSADYDKTLMAWYQNFESGWEELSRIYDEAFHRMWRYYLLACAGAFRARHNQLWQIVFSKRGIPGGYKSIR